MTEVSKEAVEAFEKAMNLAFEYHYDPPYNAPISECVKVAMEMLGDSGFTIAPIAPVTDEKLREAVDWMCSVARDDPHLTGNGRDTWARHKSTLESALTELTKLRAAAKNIDYHADTLRYTMTQKFSRQEIDFARDNLLTAVAELPTPPKED